MGGASNSGGAATGGSATGGKAAGGVPAGGMATGGAVAGGTKATGGAVAGGTKATGGAATGGAATGGAAAGGTSSGVTDWLHTQGNQIQHQDGTRFHGRGADIFDTRQCGGCKWAQPDVPEVIRRVDTLVDVWHANFMRFDLSAFTQSTDPQWGDVTQDPVYLAGLVEIMTHIGTKPGVYVMITMFGHPSMDANELPTAATMPVYQKLSDTFKDMPQVLYGITNEPHGATDAAVWTAMNNAVTAIRSMEPAAGPHHLIAAQGTQNYARQTNYYITHPITAGGGVNIIYETHPYNPPADWTSLVVTPAQSLPLIIGEFGPVTGTMTVTDCGNLMVLAEQNEVPYAVWSFSPQCGPTLLVTEPSTVDCAGGFPLTASDWGNALIQQLAKPY
jgi:endoglucanase